MLRTYSSAFAAALLLASPAGARATHAPANVVLPTISGSAVRGQMLTATTGGWSGAPLTYVYAWYDCNSAGTSCVKIAGARASSYRIVLADVGRRIRVAVTASNASGSATARSLLTVVVKTADVSPPTAPSALTGAGGTAQIALSWSAATDNVGVVGYTVYLAGATVDTTAARTYTLTGLTCGKSYAVAVDAFDAAGNHSARASRSVATAACPTTVTVGTTELGDLSTRITSNNVYAGMIDENPLAQANFAALRLPLVRLHVGDDGWPVAMPEVTKNDWSFDALDVLVNDETSLGLEPVMNVKFAPDWMWTCSSFGQPGQVADQTFQTFAAYMARLVSYYNRGSMTTETGQTIVNPAGTSNRIVYWELWNEPDLDNETPCAPASGQSLTPDQYVRMWNAVTPAMLAVDPGLKFIGPATAGGQFGSDTGAGNDYVTQLMQDATVKPSALSFHGYGYWDNTVSDAWIFDGDDTGAGGIGGFVSAAAAVHTTYPDVPIWITEMNVNADWGADPHGRPWGPFAAAWWGTAYAELAPLDVAMLDHYNVAEGPQFGLIDDQTGNPFLPYWIVKGLNAAFPPGSTRLASSSSDPQITTLAARRPDGTISVLVADRRVDPSRPTAGQGLPADVSVSLAGAAARAVSLQQIDKTTPTVQGPATVSLAPAQPLTLHFPGYGLALLTITPAG